MCYDSRQACERCGGYTQNYTTHYTARYDYVVFSFLQIRRCLLSGISQDVHSSAGPGRPFGALADAVTLLLNASLMPFSRFIPVPHRDLKSILLVVRR